MSDSEIQWSRKSLDELVNFYYTVIRPAMRNDGYDPPNGRPTYQWLADQGFSGLSYTLREHHDLTLKEFFINEVGLDGELPTGSSDDSFDWGVRNQDTIDTLTTYLDTQRDRGGLAESTVRSRRSRLAEYARTYEQLHGAKSITHHLSDVDHRPAENERCMQVFDELKDQLTTDQTRLKYLSDVQQFYEYLVQFRGAKYNPLRNANNQFRWVAERPDNKTVSVRGMQTIYETTSTIESELLVLALGAWGLRPNEVASLSIDQFILNDDGGNRIVFQSRKNGPGEVSLLFGVEVLNQRIIDLESDEWQGYLFPSSQSSSGHITTKTVNNRFKRLASEASVSVDGQTPTAKMGRRFWYTIYNEAVENMMEGLTGIASDQGSLSTDVVAKNYLSEAEKRKYRRELMQKKLKEVFD
jgi:site-specific recombinase XerD